ncbi:hypothetical protein [Methylobacterium sp. SD21]|uniref:hypothetical protein n=1 Tax=Methylobacterium litchii TaxID=3138810 RepID=UPI00313A92AF
MPTVLGWPSLQTTTLGPIVDPMPRLFAEFRALLDRHEAALAACDRIEATLTAQIGPPRVALPPDEDGVRRHATDASTLTEALPLGPHRRRLQRALQRRQRRWDEAARRAGLTGALLSEAAFDEAVLDHADGLIATPARTLDAVVIKLLVLLSSREPGPSAAGLSPWRELRTILQDLRGLVATGEADR